MRRTARISAIASLTAGVVVIPGCVASHDAGWSAVRDIQFEVFVTYTLLCAAALVVATLATRARIRGWPATFSASLLGAVLGFPLATIAATALQPYPETAIVALRLPLALTAAAALVVALGHRTGYAPLAVSTIGLATAAAICAEQLAGGQLSPLTLFGYDVSAGLRLYGLGNEMAALMVAGLVAGSAGALAGAGEGGWVTAYRSWGFPLVAGVSLMVAAVPALGANVGVVLWGGAACSSWWWLQGGRRIGWREAAVAVVAVVAVVVALVWLDVASGEPTHVGAAWLAVTSGRAADVGALIAGRFATSWRIVTYSPAALAPVALAAVLAWVRFRPGEIARALFRRAPGLRAAIDATLIATPVALLAEDSGTVVPAVMMLFASAVCLTATLGTPKGARA